MRKITLFVLIAVCVVVLLATEPCEGKKNTDVAAGEGGGTAAGDKPVRRGRPNRERKPGQDDEQPGENGKRHGRRNRQHGNNKNNKPSEEDSKSSSREKE